TRSGDVDPAIMSYLGRRQGIQPDNVERMLNEQSGLRGLSGLSDDMAVLLEAEKQNHPRAKMALEVFCYRVRKYLGAYLVALGGADAVIFSGGIGEHAPEIRGRICQDMEWCGRSEEHTSELQSRSDLVCRLLLEKKKKKKKKKKKQNNTK